MRNRLRIGSKDGGALAAPNMWAACAAPPGKRNADRPGTCHGLWSGSLLTGRSAERISRKRLATLVQDSPG